MSGEDCIAIDWGTTNRLVMVLAPDGRIRRSSRDDRGVLAFGGENFEAEIHALRAVYGSLPIFAAGMITSARGWIEVPYCDLPADLAALGEASVLVPECNVTLLPGLAQRVPDRADVMRGEEIQVLGAIAAGHAPQTGLFCQPGTHNKWVEVDDGRVMSFSTAMTGEMFALLRQHSLLAEMLTGEVRDGAAFRAGLARGAMATDLLTALFEVRAAALLGAREPPQSAAYASGLLIGADVGARSDLAGRQVHLLGSGGLVDLYAAALSALGAIACPLDSEACFAAGIHHLRTMLA